MIRLFFKRTAQLIHWTVTFQLGARLRERKTKIVFFLKRSGRVAFFTLTLRLPTLLRERKTAKTLRSSGLFDTTRYLERYRDVAESGLDPVDHYIRHGAAEFRNPNGIFETRYYLDTNPDVLESGRNPLLHFIEHGHAEKRKPNALFDTAYYLEQKPALERSGQNPLRHYLEQGYMEDANPHALFDQAFYRNGHPELRETGESPLAHYLRQSENASSGTPSSNSEWNFSAEVAQSSAWPPATSLPRLLAFFLPQFHPVPENDEWWGPGFTEWTNVTKANPLYPGHDQPKLPGELGYYDLRIPEVRQKQAELASEYGISGFCYYYYWFEGRRILERPLDEVVASGEPDFPFCICWANENWTRRWDGLEDDVLLRQEHSLRSDHAFIQDVLPILKDPRYITVDGKPLLIVYRADKIRSPEKTASMWRDAAVQAGLPGLHLCAVEFRTSDPRPLGFDAAIEFPPHHFPAPALDESDIAAAGVFEGKLLNYTAGAANALRTSSPDYVRYRGIVPNWDNTARSGLKATIFRGSTPKAYEKWLSGLIDQVVNRGGPSSRFVFVNAWNEWAEGAYLEPDRRHGRGYLEATRSALDFGERALKKRRAVRTPKPDAEATDHAIPLLVIGHDAAAAGSQYVLLEFLRTLKGMPKYAPHLILQEEGALLSDYRDVATTTVLGGVPNPGTPAQSKLIETIDALKAAGLGAAICNTVVTAPAAKICSERGLRVVCLVHEQPDSIEKLFGGRETMSLVEESATRIVVVSKFAGDALQEQYGDLADRIEIIHPPLRELPRVKHRRERARIEILGNKRAKRGDFLVLGCGTLYPRKGPDLFIEVAREVGHLDPELHCAFLWAGGGLTESAVSDHNAIANRLGVDDVVQFVGEIDDVSRLLVASDLFALTSREDPFPLVNMEALSFGVPVVAFAQTGGAPELIESDAGVVVPHLDVRAMAKAVVSLARNQRQRQDMGAAARMKMTERFSSEHYTRELLEQVFPMGCAKPNAPGGPSPTGET